MENAPNPQVRMRAQSVGGRVYTAQTGSDQVKVYASHADANNDTNGSNVTATLRQAQSRTAMGSGSNSAKNLHGQAVQWSPDESELPESMPSHVPTSCVEARLQMAIASNNVTSPSKATTQFSNQIFENKKVSPRTPYGQYSNETKKQYKARVQDFTDREAQRLKPVNKAIARKSQVAGAWKNSENSMYGAAIEDGKVKKRCGWCEQRGFSDDGKSNGGRRYKLGK